MRRPDARSLLLLACLKLAAARVTVRYLAGCPDSTADNYYAPNPTGDQTDCVYAPTLYCPDANAENYADACELLAPARLAHALLAVHSARLLHLAMDETRRHIGRAASKRHKGPWHTALRYRSAHAPPPSCQLRAARADAVPLICVGSWHLPHRGAGGLRVCPARLHGFGGQQLPIRGRARRAVAVPVRWV